MSEAVTPIEALAAELGVTPLQAARMYRRPLSEVFLVYVWGIPGVIARIGCTDRFSCWWAPQEEVAKAFGQPANDRQRRATNSAAVSKAEARAARRRAALGGGRA